MGKIHKICGIFTLIVVFLPILFIRDLSAAPAPSGNIAITAIATSESKGDRDGCIDPGEEISVVISLKAMGRDFQNVTLRVRPAGNHINMVRDASPYGILLNGREAPNLRQPIIFKLDKDCPKGAKIRFIADMYAVGYFRSESFYVDVFKPYPISAPGTISGVVVGDIDRDRDLDIIATSLEGKVYCFDSEGRKKWGYAAALPIKVSPALHDLDGDGIVETVICAGNKVICLDKSGKVVWECLVIKEGELSSPAVASMSENGEKYIIVSARDTKPVTDGGLYAINSKGRPVWRAFRKINFTPVAVADINGDETCEILAGADNGSIYCFSARDSGPALLKQLWQYNNAAPKSFSYPVISDLENDGKMEILAGSDDGNLYCLSNEGQLVWRAPAGVLSAKGVSPAVADLDADGTKEIIAATKEDGPTNKIFCFDKDGNAVWEYDVNSKAAFSPVAADLNRDGNPEIIVGSHDLTIRCLDAHGACLWRYPVKHGVKSPLAIADLNGDGALEVICGSSDFIYVVDKYGRDFMPLETEQNLRTLPWPMYQANLKATGDYEYHPVPGPWFLRARLGGREGVYLTWVFKESDIKKISHFEIEYSPDGEQYCYVEKVDRMCTDCRLPIEYSKATYLYRIYAVGMSGELSPFSNIAVPDLETIPYAPTNLWEYAKSHDKVTLIWNDNSRNESHFIVELSGNGVNFAPSSEPIAYGNNGATIYEVGSLAPDTVYYFRVRAYNAEYGFSEYSDTLSVETLPAPIPPAAPSDLMITGYPVSATASGISLEWQDNSNNETGFYIYYGESIDNLERIRIIGGTSYSFLYLRPARVYYFKVTAYNGYGESGPSNIVSGETNPLLNSPPAYPPRNLTATYTDGKVVLQWEGNPPNASSFRIERKMASGFFANLTLIPSGGAKSYEDSWNLSPATKYVYRVRAENYYGVSEYTNEAEVITPGVAIENTAPLPATDLQANKSGAEHVVLTWKDNSDNESRFRIFRQKKGSGSWIQRADIERNSTSYRDEVKVGQKYSYKVRAYNYKTGHQGDSNIVLWEGK